MSKLARILFFAFFLAIVSAGCSNISKYDDAEVAAVVKGEEITVGDLRFLYSDDTALDYLDSAIKDELIKQEVQRMGLDIADQLDEESSFEKLPPKNSKDSKQIRKYAEAQAKKLAMTPEDYQKQYAQKLNERNAYINTYLKETLDEGNINDERWVEEHSDELDQLLETLVTENEEEIEIFIR